MIHYGDAMLDLFRKSINKNTNLRRCANYQLVTVQWTIRNKSHNAPNLQRVRNQYFNSIHVRCVVAADPLLLNGKILNRSPLLLLQTLPAVCTMT